MAELPPYEAPIDPAARRVGLVAAAALTAIIALVMFVMAFSTYNAPMSNDGVKGTSSQWVSESGD